MKTKKAVQVSQEHAEKMVKELYENFPEASAGSCLSCVKWHYGKTGQPFLFVFIDEEEDGTRHDVDLKAAVRGFCKFVDLVLAGKLPGLFASGSLGPNWLTDAGDWDGYSIDALNQCAIFGEVIYG